MFIEYLNQFEKWLNDNKSKLYLFPVIGGGYLLMFLVLMVSNFWALLRWPIASFNRTFIQKENPSGNYIRDNTVNELNGDAQELANILQQQKKNLVLIYFWAEWCGPCMMMNKPLKKIAESDDINCTIIKIDTVKHKKLAESYHVKGLPTLLLMRNNEELKRYAGALSYRELKNFVDV